MFTKYTSDSYRHSRNNGIFQSHEAIRVLNTQKKRIAIDLILYFEDRGVMAGFYVDIKPKRALHIRMGQTIDT